MTGRKATGRAWSARSARSAPIGPPAPATSAIDRLERLLYVISRASGREGVALSEVSRELGVEPTTVVRDLQELQERDLYHSGGGADDFQIEIGPDRVRVWCAHRLDRPTKLSPREALALWLGLEVVRMTARGEEGESEIAAARLIRYLSRLTEGEVCGLVAAPPVSTDEHGLRASLGQAAAECRVCEISYVKPGATEPETRRVDPYALVHAEGRWYLIARCAHAEAVRSFRLDRVVAVEVRNEACERPPDFDPAEHLDVEGGRVLDGSRTVEATVRYTPVIARWIAERERGDWLKDGSYVVRHGVADPEWLVRHVLQYGGQAKILEPVEWRVLVHDRAMRIVANS